MAATENDPLFDQTELTIYLNHAVTEATLEKWRCTGDGPPFIKVGRTPRYRRSVVDHWLTTRTRLHTHEHPPAPPTSPTRATSRTRGNPQETHGRPTTAEAAPDAEQPRRTRSMRSCARCGIAFDSRRPHQQFCGPSCRRAAFQARAAG